MDADEGRRGVVAATACFPYRLPKLIVHYGRLETEPFVPALVGDDPSVEGVAHHIPHAVPGE